MNDHNFAPFSADNPFRYEKEFISDDVQEKGFQIVSRIGIIARDKYDENDVLYSAIICESGGATTINDQTYLIKEENLILCICDMVYCLDIISLDLKWKIQVDQATCFSIHEFGEGLITHGELELTHLDFKGAIQWQFSARDIFVTHDSEHVFRIENGLATVKDWSGYEYSLNSKGEVVKEIKPSA